MLDIKLIREKPDYVKKAIESKGYKAPIDDILHLDSERRKFQKQVDDFAATKNKTSKEISKANKEDREKLIAEMREVDKKSDAIKQYLESIANTLDKLLLELPNLPAEDVKVGKNDSENEVTRTVLKQPKFTFTPLDHMALGETLDIIDTERAAKVSGSRFSYLKNQAAMLEFALVRFALDKLTKKGFKFLIPPVMVKTDSLRDSGHLMAGEETERYAFPQDDLYLVGTSEQSVVPMHRDEIFEEKQLPLRYVAFSTCFRREAGSYGKDVKGILRLHQFDKLEMVSFVRPEDSEAEHEFLLKCEEEIMKELKLPYHVLKMCTGDLGGTAARKYDIEAWIPSQKQYRETHSTSNCTDFQARRLNIRMRRKGGLELVHILNGTAVTGRVLIAILENYQNKDGSVEAPKVLRKYVGFKKINVLK